MFRLGFGFKDAPRTRNLVLAKTLAEFRPRPTTTDSRLFVKRDAHGHLQPILRGVGEGKVRDAICRVEFSSER